MYDLCKPLSYSTFLSTRPELNPKVVVDEMFANNSLVCWSVVIACTPLHLNCNIFGECGGVPDLYHCVWHAGT